MEVLDSSYTHGSPYSMMEFSSVGMWVWYYFPDTSVYRASEVGQSYSLVRFTGLFTQAGYQSCNGPVCLSLFLVVRERRLEL